MNKIKPQALWHIVRTIPIIIIIGLVIFSLLVIISLPKLPKDLNDIALSTPTVFYSRNGQKIMEASDRQVLPGNDIPGSFKYAIMAMEDYRFFRHHGISKRGILRALMVDLRHKGHREGGSTITQQLAKNLFFEFEKKYMRKIKEAFLAMQIEQQFTKEEILTAYCNQIAFGQNVYGVELAAQTYFGKHARELKIEESILLAGLPRSPSYYNPYHSPEMAKKRQQLVLRQMVKYDMLTQVQADSLVALPLEYRHINELWRKADYFIDEVERFVESKFGANALHYGGLKIYTSLDTRLQRIAIQAVKSGLNQLESQMGLTDYDRASIQERRDNYLQAALVALDPRDGSVVAMVGGRDYRVSQYNRATSQQRQPGSSFKPFIYLTAFENGVITPTTVFNDTLKKFSMGKQIYTPRNFNNKYYGNVIPKFALTNSLNSVSTQVIVKAGPRNVVETAKKLGITAELHAFLSLSLGTDGISPLEMAAAYCPFANGGIARRPRLLTRIESHSGTLLTEINVEGYRAISSPEIAYIILDMMRNVVEEGTAQSIRTSGFDRPAAGKTGTTTDYKDAWFVGFTPDLVCAVWVGFDNPRPMKNKNGRGVTGAQAAIPIWVDFMRKALSDRHYRDFEIPPGISFENYDYRSGKLAKSDDEAMRVAVIRRFDRHDQ